MSAVNELQEQLEATKTAGFVTSMLRDISATKLQAIREAFERNEAFYKEINDLDALVQAYALRNKIQNKKSTEGKQVFVGLTANKRFAGTLNKDVTDRFADRMSKDKESDGLMIGKTGRQYLEGTKHEKRCHYFEFAGEDPTEEEGLKLMEQLAEYDNVFVFYPSFINSFRQEIAMIDITHKADPKEVENMEVEYIFEPEIRKLLKFFDTQVRIILFNRVLLETKVAQTGARLTKMQRSHDRTEDMVEEQERMIHKQTKTMQGLRLMETFAGFNRKKEA